MHNIPQNISDHQSESNINILSNKVSNILNLKSYTSSAQESERTNLSPTALPVASIPIRIITVSLCAGDRKHPDRRKLKFSIIKEDGTQTQYTSNLTCYSRKRELLSNLSEEYKQWEGYTQALNFMSELPDRDSAYIGKLKNSTTYQLGVPKNMPVVAKTVALLWADDHGAHVRVWLGSKTYDLDLYSEGLSSAQKHYYIAQGQWRNETETVVEEFD
jgi:hypothetical protein